MLYRPHDASGCSTDSAEAAVYSTDVTAKPVVVHTLTKPACLQLKEANVEVPSGAWWAAAYQIHCDNADDEQGE